MVFGGKNVTVKEEKPVEFLSVNQYFLRKLTKITNDTIVFYGNK